MGMPGKDVKGCIKKVLVTVNYSGDENNQRLAAALAPAEIIRINHKDSEAVIEAIRDADAAILGGDITKAMLQAGSCLKWVHCDHAGLNNSAHPEIFERGIILSSSAGRSAPVLAEHIMYFIFSLIYNSRLQEEYQRKHIWSNPCEGRLGLSSKTVGIIGLGKTALELVKRLRGFDVRVLAFSRTEREENCPGIDVIFSRSRGDTIDSLLKESDIIVLCCSLNDETFHLIDERAFALMKRDAILINMARGSVVDEKALYKALKEKRIAGAASDVFEEEPLPNESPLWDLQNMLITP
ncbi:D-2-hydroxyacid dehydrogenase, partial [Treponema sp. OttesenSCG-928-L16]|nr:D-2-hydroxyacid dehydrogenase [Treponema sp. OttesenSCG-928-L16]